MRVPVLVKLPSTRSLLVFKVTLVPVLALTAPVKLLLDVFKVIALLAPAAKAVVPVTLTAPDWVIVPPAFTVKAPLTALAPKTIPLVSVKETLLPELIATVLKLLPALFKVMLLLEPAASVLTPVAVTAVEAAWVIAPVLVMLKVPVAVVLPSDRARLVVI